MMTSPADEPNIGLVRGILIVLLVGLTLYLCKTGWISLTFLPGLGIWYCIKTARHDPVTEIFVGSIWIAIVVAGVLALKRFFGLL